MNSASCISSAVRFSSPGPAGFFLLLLPGLLLGSCGGGGSSWSTPDAVSRDVGQDLTVEVCELSGEQVCCPGQTNGCSDDRLGIYECLPDGLGWVRRDCFGDNGEASICLTDAETSQAYCTGCKPGQRSCGDEDRVMMCNEDGRGWSETVNCDPAVTGNICQQGTCTSLCEINYKLEMYMGCEFWAVDLDNAFVASGRSDFVDAAGSQFSVVVSNPSLKYPARVDIFGIEGRIEVDGRGMDISTDPIPPGELRIFNLPRRDADGTVIAPLAYRVASSIPITAYQFNPLENEKVYSNDASLLLPTNVAGKYYFIMTREQSFDQLRSFLTVVAVQPGVTSVSLDVTAPTLIGVDTRTNKEIKHLEPGESMTAELNQFDVLNIETNKIGSDLTGSMVLANKDVAVFGGSEAANAPNTNHCVLPEDGGVGFCEADPEYPCMETADCSKYITCCADHLEQQLFPVKSWGTRYVASKAVPRNQELDVYRIIAAENNTMVTTLPVQVSIPILHRGEWVDFESKEDFEVVADKPIMVGQFLAAEQAPDPGEDESTDAGTGDPAFILLVPEEQFRTEYVFLAPDKYEFDYVTVVAPADATVWFDCLHGDGGLEDCDPIPEDDYNWYISGEYKTAKFEIEDGTHRIDANKPVGVYVYGFDQYVSYGYPAGLDIRDLGLIKEPGEL